MAGPASLKNDEVSAQSKNIPLEVKLPRLPRNNIAAFPMQELAISLRACFANLAGVAM